MAQQLSNINIRQRMTQVLVLIILIIAGMLFARPADAQSVNRKLKNITTKQFSSKRTSNKACYLLYKKRTASHNRSVLVSAKTSRRTKYKPMAETDQPVRTSSMD